jgi:tetratricopeptide (TPR) repeat protein
MKVAHLNKNEVSNRDEWLAEAQEQEAGGHLEMAARIYEKIIRKAPLTEPAYNRLLIIYRKLKEYKKELAVINTGIKAFEAMFYKSRVPAGNNKVTRLSRSLMKSVGLTDKKGKTLYEPDPIARWRKRKAIVEKRLKK